MGESFQDYSWIQDFEANFLWRVSLKMLNQGDYNSLSDLFSVCQKAIAHLNLKLLIFSGYNLSFQDYSWNQDYEADFLWKVSLKMLNQGDYISVSDLFSVCQKTIKHLYLKLWIFRGYTFSFKIGVSKVQDFGNFELSPMTKVQRRPAFVSVHSDQHLYYSLSRMHKKKYSNLPHAKFHHSVESL